MVIHFLFVFNITKEFEKKTKLIEFTVLEIEKVFKYEMLSEKLQLPLGGKNLQLHYT